MKFFDKCNTKKSSPVEDKVFIPEKQNSVVNIYYAAKPVFLVSRVLGIAPFVLRSDPQRFEFSKSVALCGVFLTIVLSIILIKATHNVVSDVDPALFRFVTILQLLNLVVPSVFHRLMALANAKTVILVMTQLEHIDNVIGTKEHCHIKGFRYSLLAVIITTVSFVTYSCARVFLAREIELSNSSLSVLPSVAALSAVLTFYITECQFVGLVLLIRQRFVELNKTVMNVASIRKIHDQLCGLCEAVNSCFSPQILTNVLLSFISLTYSCYFCCLSILGQDRGVYSGVDWDVLTLYGLVITVFSLVFKLAACHCTAAEGNKTAVLLHRQYDKLTDVEEKMEVQMLSLQLIHNTIRFSACGVFPLDLSLLYSIVGAVTTYLVILIQFQLSTPGDNNVLDRPSNVTSSLLYEIR